MRMSSRHILAVVVALAVAGGGVLWAQPGAPAADAQIQAGSEPDGASEGGAGETAPAGAQAGMSPQEMMADAERLAGEIHGVRVEVLGLQAEAREDKDMVRLDCIDDKLAQLDELLAITDAARGDLAAAVAAGDRDRRAHHHELVTLARDKAAVVREEADACVGEEMRFPGDADVGMDDPGLDDPTRFAPFDLADNPLLDEAIDDPSDAPWEEDVTIERPSYATPFI